MPHDIVTIEQQKQQAAEWFRSLRNQLCALFETLEDELDSAAKPAGRFERKAWQREGGGGGGEMSIMRGRLFEKVGINISTVHGEFSETMRKEVPGAEQNPRFWASGVSLVAHLCSPLVPAVHMNTRMLVIGDATRQWFGGGADLTPMFPDTSDAEDFHTAFKATCDRFNPDYYPKYKKWCDEYFFLKHRDEPRGVGGIFYDYLDSGNWQDDFAFTQGVGQTLADIYPQLVRRHMHKPWTEEQRQWQLVKRGRYVEFNLLFDRGTRFGIMTGGHTEAILMSLPPEVRWP
jgi:coproporphyrinogen III oxidase